jgi:uncharacterized protein YggE
MEMENMNMPHGRMGPAWLKMLIGLAVLVSLLLWIVGKGYDLSQTFNHKNPKNTISVTAEGKVTAVPDLATVSLGVLTQGESVSSVQDEGSKKINKITEFVKAQGVDAKDITTSDFSIYPQQDYQTGKPVITGYQSNQTISVKVRGVDKSPEKLGKILAGAVQAGSNQVNGVNLSFDDPNNLQQQARLQAIDKAKQKAQELAEATHLKLGNVVNFSESSSYGGPIAYDKAYAGEGYGGGGAPVAPNVQPGQQDIVADMTVVFEIR